MLPPAPGHATTTVVMVTYHTGELLWHAIDSVLAQPDVCELLLVNNGNPAPVAEHLRHLCQREPRIRLYTGHGNIGFAKACNMAAQDATGHYLLFLNPDCVLPDGGTAYLASVLTHAPQAWLAAPRIMNPDGSEQSGSRRNLLTPLNSMSEMTRLYRLFPHSHWAARFKRHEEPPLMMVSLMPAVSGACMMMPRERFMQIDGFDSAYFMHVEDVDLCLRIHQRGGLVLYCGEMNVLHQQGSSNACSLKVQRYKTRSVCRYFLTHFRRPLYFPLTAAMCGLAWSHYAVSWLRHRLRADSGPTAHSTSTTQMGHA